MRESFSDVRVSRTWTSRFLDEVKALAISK
jgi:hypothetical protein